MWAAKFAARHPNLVAVELSNFKCGHDAPIYSTIEAIVESSGTPYFAFKDLDENRPAGSIKLRLQTIDYSLGRYGATACVGAAAGGPHRAMAGRDERRMKRGTPFSLLTVARPACVSGSSPPLLEPHLVHELVDQEYPRPLGLRQVGFEPGGSAGRDIES